jgi:hypothetical protein
VRAASIESDAAAQQAVEERCNSARGAQFEEMKPPPMEKDSQEKG